MRKSIEQRIKEKAEQDKKQKQEKEQHTKEQVMFQGKWIEVE